MNKIKSIILKDKMNVVGFVDFDHDFEFEGLKIKVIPENAKDNESHVEISSAGKIRSYNIDDGDFKIVYYDKETNPNGLEKYAKHVQRVEIKKYIIQGEDVLQNQSVKQKIYSLVKDNLDNFGTNQAEKEMHLKILRTVTSDPQSRKYLLNKIEEIILNSQIIKKEHIEGVSQEIYSKFYGMDIIQELDDDPEVGEIMVNAWTYPKFRCDIYYIKNQVKHFHEETFETFDDMMRVFKRSVEFAGAEINEVDSPQIEAERANRDRVTITVPLASENYSMNIRKFSNFAPTSEEMKKAGTVTDEMEPLIQAIVRGKANIGIGGAMGTGKTSLIQYLLSLTHKIERKTVIASVSEMDIERVLKGHDIVILKINEERNLTFAKQISTALRTSAGRIIIPESRSDEMKSIYEASLKIKGNMYTSHASSAREFLTSSTNSYLASEKNVQYTFKEAIDKIADNLHVIFIMRTVGASIRIDSISEVVVEDGVYKDINDLVVWEYSEENPLEGRYVMKNKMTSRLKHILNKNGIPMSSLNNL